VIAQVIPVNRGSFHNKPQYVHIDSTVSETTRGPICGAVYSTKGIGFLALRKKKVGLSFAKILLQVMRPLTALLGKLPRSRGLGFTGICSNTQMQQKFLEFW